MNATKTTTKKTRKSCFDNSTHTRYSRQDADDCAHRDCNLPVLYRMAVTDSYERDDNDGENEGKVTQRTV